MQLDGPKFVPKAVLTAGRIAHQPFEVPTEMTKSALLQGGTIHAAVGSINKAAADAVAALEPRGPAKLLDKLFGKVDGSLVHSAGQAKKATEVFWVPFSNGAHQVGHAVSNPFSLFYAKRAGFEIPEDPAALQAMLAGITNPSEAPDGDQSTKFPGFKFPVPPPPAEEPPPADTPPADTPPAETPPADTPPADEAPADTPPADEAPADAPPADAPPADAPAEDAPPADAPAAEGDAAPASGGGDEAAVDPAAAGGGGEIEASATPEGARSIAPSVDVAPQSHPAGIDPAVMAAAAAASVASPSTDPAPVQDAAAGVDATTVPVQDDAPVGPPVTDAPPVQDAPPADVVPTT